MSIQTTGEVSKDGTSDVFAPLKRPAGLPPTMNRRVGDLGNIQSEISYGYAQASNDLGVSLSDPLRSVVGRAIAIHQGPFIDGGTMNPIVAWGVLGLASPTIGSNQVNAASSSGDLGDSMSVVCRLHSLGSNQDVLRVDGIIRMTDVVTKDVNGTNLLRSLLVRGELNFVSGSTATGGRREEEEKESRYSLEIHEYGDLATGNIGVIHGATPSSKEEVCPTSLTRVGFLGDVKRVGNNAGSGSSGPTSYVALLHPGAGASTPADSLRSMIGRACVLTSGPHDDVTRVNLAIGVIAIARKDNVNDIDAKKREIEQFEIDVKNRTLGEFLGFFFI